MQVIELYYLSLLCIVTASCFVMTSCDCSFEFADTNSPLTKKDVRKIRKGKPVSIGDQNYQEISELSGKNVKTRFMFEGEDGKIYIRPGWAGKVEMNVQNGFIEYVDGTIVPVATGARKGPPEAFGINIRKLNKEPKYSGISSLDRSHVGALRNGYPDITFNVVGAPAKWQRPGGSWYTLEQVKHKVARRLYKKSGQCKGGSDQPKVRVRDRMEIKRDAYDSDLMPTEYTGKITLEDENGKILKEFPYEIKTGGEFKWTGKGKDADPLEFVTSLADDLVFL